MERARFCFSLCHAKSRRNELKTLSNFGGLDDRFWFELVSLVGPFCFFKQSIYVFP